MQVLIFLSSMVVATLAAPGYLDFGIPSPTIIKAAPIFPAPILPPPTIIKTISAPVFAPPLFAPAPIIKTVAPFPVIKAVAPATSYATITQFVQPAPIYKTVVAPQPILKSFVAAPLPYHGFHH